MSTDSLLEADVQRMCESLLARGEARLGELQEGLERGDQELRAVLDDFAAEASREEARVRAELESRKAARAVVLAPSSQRPAAGEAEDVA